MAQWIGIRYGVGGGFSVGGGESSEEFEEIHLVLADSTDERSPEIAAVPEIPRRGDLWSGESSSSDIARCVDVIPKEIAHLVWEVTCKFSTEISERDQEASD